MNKFLVFFSRPSVAVWVHLMFYPGQTVEVLILNGCIDPAGCIAEVQAFGSRHACRWVDFDISLLHVLSFENILEQLPITLRPKF